MNTFVDELDVGNGGVVLDSNFFLELFNGCCGSEVDVKGERLLF